MSVKHFFHTVNSYHFALLAGQIICGTILSYFVWNKSINPSSTQHEPLLLTFIPLIIMGCIFTGNLFMRSRVKKAKKLTDLRHKLSTYQSGNLIKWMFLECASLITLLAFLVSGNLIMLGLALVVFMIFISMLPSPIRVILDLELTGEEKSLVESKGTPPAKELI